jgi:uncharacterized protein YqjF (DUF2071 family)
MPRPFLTARWERLCILSYAVEPSRLAPHMPPGFEPDTSLDGRAYVSLVAFDFLDTRVAGVRWPGLVNFPEINLRFYVRETPCPGFAARRGVCFVREFVPSHVISWIARAFYNEPYHAARMSSNRLSEQGREHPSTVAVVHELEFAGSRLRLALTAGPEEHVPAPDSAEHWFKEHEWGYGTARSGALVRYRVHHPHWAVRNVQRAEVNADWAGLYGSGWDTLVGRAPDSVVFAVGSRVEVLAREA